MSKENNQGTEVQNSKKKSKSYKKSKKLIFGLLWLLFLFRIFITDIGLVLNHKFIGFDGLKFIVIRLLVLSLIVILTWIRLGNKRFWKNVGLFFLYPIYPFGTTFIKNIVWGIPKFLFEKKYIGLLINYFDIVVGYIYNFKRNFAIQITGILTFIFLFSFKGYWLLIPISSLSFLMLYHLYRRYTQTFEPIRLFQIDLERFSNVEGEIFNRQVFEDTISDAKVAKDKACDMSESHTEESKNDTIIVPEIVHEGSEAERPKSDKSNDKLIIELDEQGKILDKRLQNALIVSELVRVFKYKMEDVLTSRSYMKSFIWKAIYSFLFSMVIFGGINYAIYQLNPANYNSDFTPTYFNFFYYSFFTIIPDGTDIEPITQLSKSIRMMGVGVGVFINLLILAVYFTVSSDRYKANLERLVKISDEYSKGANSYFVEKYGKSPTEAMKDLKGRSTELETQIYFLKNLLKIK